MNKASGLAAVGMTAFVMALAAGEARAHALETSLEPLPGQAHTLVLHSQFSTGEPAADAAVALIAPGQEPIPLGRTDSSGQLLFQRPDPSLLVQVPDWEVRIDQGSGHRDYVELPAATPLPTATTAPRRPTVNPWLAWAGGCLALVGAVALKHPRQDR